MAKFKKFAAFALAGMMMMANAVPVMAANTGNTTFRFESSTTYTTTSARAKENSTPIYVRVDATRPYAYIKVQGFVPNGSTGTSFWTNCTYNTDQVIARPGTNYSIRSTVYEKGGRSARLQGKSGGNTMTGGVWSPDSSGTYTFLN